MKIYIKRIKKYSYSNFKDIKNHFLSWIFFFYLICHSYVFLAILDETPI